MEVAMSGISQERSGEAIAVVPCLMAETAAISQSVDTKDIVKPDDRRILVEEPATVETELPGFCDYYVIGQFCPVIESISNDAGTEEGGVVVGNRIIDEYRSTGGGRNYPGETSAVIGLIAGNEILDDQSIRNIRHVEAASLASQGIIPLDDIPFDDRGSSSKHVDATSKQTRVVGDHIVEDFRRRSPPDADSTTTSSATKIGAVAGDGV